jgi:hypothetical protein
MSGQSISRNGTSRAYVAWLWFFVLLFLLPGSAVFPEATDLSILEKSLAAPTHLTGCLATPVQKSKETKLSFKDLPAVAGEDIALPSCSSLVHVLFPTELSFSLHSAVRPSALLPRPPPIA